MKARPLIAVVTVIFLSACIYDAPLVGQASLPIDAALLGSWEIIPQNPAQQETPERLLISRKSANLYEIQYSADQSTLYFNAWLAELEGIRFIQLEVTGDEDGPVGPQDTNLFSVLSYVLENGAMVVKSLNEDLVNADLVGTEALQAAFTAHRDNPSLFDNPGTFRKL